MGENTNDIKKPGVFQSIGEFLKNAFSYGPAAAAETESESETEQSATQAAPAYSPTAAPAGGGTESSGPSEEITEDVKGHLSAREGFRKDVYLDTEGKATAGTGHLLSASELRQYPLGSIVPDAVLAQWLVEDSEGAYSAAYMQAVEIGYENQTLVDALTAVNFQLGTAWNGIHKNTWAKLMAHDWEGAALEAGDSKWYSQTPVRVFDFQRSLLLIAGKPIDYASMVAFNAGNTSKWGAELPTESSVNEFTPTMGESSEGGETETPGRGTEETPDNSSPGTDTPSNETETPAPDTETPTGAGQLSSSVGLADDGTTYVGESGDIKSVQQQLVYAGILPAEQMSRTGDMVSTVDGFLGPATIDAIKQFQSNVMGFSNPDGRVDAGGKTWGKLSTYAAQENPVPDEGNGTAPEEDLGGGVPDQEAPKEEETVAPNPGETDELETIPDGGGAVPDQEEATDFESIPASYKSQYTTTGSVGVSGNAANDKEKIQAMLRMCGYKTTYIGSGNGTAEQRRVQLANSIFHFQSKHADLSNDGTVSAGKATWKKLIVVSYMNSGGETMTDDQIDQLHNARKGSVADVPGNLTADITGGHLIGIDNSGYLLPTEFHSNAEKLVEALETIKEETGNFRISCGYRSPEHNVKIGSTATTSKHVVGIAADIQTMAGYTPTSLKAKIQEMIDDNLIPDGYIGLYGWGCHYDIRNGV